MNKITKKLFLYFGVVSFTLAITIFLGFSGIFQYYSYKHHEKEVRLRAETIQNRMENFMNDCAGTQELSSYIKVLDDISMADAYFISLEGETFTCTCSCNTTVTIDKTPTKQVKEFAKPVFETGEYTQIKERNTIWVGIPLIQDDIITAVVVLVDYYDVDETSFWLSISVLIICSILALIISGGLSVILAKKFMHPIQNIADTIKYLTNGEYQVKTNVHDKNEIGELARGTDILAEKLYMANQESERMEQMQKNYITNISHELRTPVTVIRSTIEALHDGVIPEEKREEYQEQMLLETIALQRLVNDMLEISRLENDEFAIESEELDLRCVLEDAVRTIRVIAAEKEIEISVNELEGEWSFVGDYGRLRQMFLAVLDNAIKYSESGKRIWIKAFAKTDYYYITIKDEGQGIEEEKQPYIFNKFYRTSHEKVSGTGLGMAIIKNIADRHKIEIRMQSKKNEGTQITFIVPINK